MPIVNAASFIADEIQTDTKYFMSGTVEATVNGKTRRVPASMDRADAPYKAIRAYRIAGKYQTGTKVWSCYVSHNLVTGREGFGGGFDSRSMSRRSVIHSLVGFMDEINETRHSQR